MGDKIEAGRRGPEFVARVALVVVLAGVLANLLFNAVATAVGADYPYTSFLFLPWDRYADFFKLALSYPGDCLMPDSGRWGMSGLLSSYERSIEVLRGTTINHFHVPPLPTLFGVTARALTHWVHPVVLFLLLLSAVLAILFTTVLRLSPPGWTAPALASATLLSYPVLFAIDRGHFFSLITAICLIGGTLRTLRDNRADGWTILLFAIALNIRPNAGLVPFLLFLTRRGMSFWNMVVLGVATVGLFGLSLGIAHQLYPEYTLASFRGGLRDYAGVYIGGDIGFPYGSSLYGMLRVLIGKNEWSLGFPIIFALALTGAAIIGSWRGLLKPSEFTFLVLSAYVLGSQIVVDYHLLVFIIPLVLLAREGGIHDRSGWAILIACSFLFAPKNYVFEGLGNPIPWSWQVVANPAVMAIACCVIVAVAWRRQPAEQGSAAATSPAAA